MIKLGRMVSFLLFAFCPSGLKVLILRLLGHTIGRNVHIGICYLDVGNLVIGNASRIGNWNVFKGIRSLTLGEGASIGRFNLFTSSSYYQQLYPNDAGIISIGPGSAVTMRHYFDVQHRIKIGAESLVAGIGTMFFTHQKGASQLDEAKPITVGNRVYIGAASVAVPGTTVGNNIVVNAGSIIGGNLSESYKLYSSPRAVAVRDLPAEHPYFVEEGPAGAIASQARTKAMSGKSE